MPIQNFSTDRANFNRFEVMNRNYINKRYGVSSIDMEASFFSEYNE